MTSKEDPYRSPYGLKIGLLDPPPLQPWHYCYYVALFTEYSFSYDAPLPYPNLRPYVLYGSPWIDFIVKSY